MSELLAQDKKYLLNVYNRMEIEIKKGEGSYLIDNDGNKYLDMFSGIAVNGLGQNQENIKDKIKEQLDDYIHLSNYFASRPVVELAHQLVDNTFADKIFFSNSGSEANEAALKLARLYAKNIAEDKTEFLAATDAFHGRTMGSLSLTGRIKYRNKFSPLVPEINHFNFNDGKDLKEKVSKKTAGVFIEIIQGEGGIHEISQDFVDTLLELSDKYNFLIIVDEIQSGMGRSGDFLALEKYDFEPDLVTMAKSLGGGLPLGAILVNKRLKEVFSYGDHGSTFGGNPLACAVGSEVVKTITDPDFQKSMEEKSKFLLTELEKLMKKYPEIINEIRGRGMMLGLETGEYGKLIKKKAKDKNLLLNLTDETVIRLLPPLNIKRDEIKEFLKIFREILAEIKG
ncbi:MAG TPA: acetylornithine/succinylornithine family transaminase [Halanaerobiales bacterium]|nr:acetylornithine/succinylornithine family transaminase [Halanaerobiales bacterium]